MNKQTVKFKCRPTQHWTHSKCSTCAVLVTTFIPHVVDGHS